MLPGVQPRAAARGAGAGRPTCAATPCSTTIRPTTGGAGCTPPASRGVDAERGHVFTDASLTLQAAVDGHGVALGRRVLVEQELAAGRLVRPFAASVPCERSYYLVTSEHTAELPRVQAFRAWLFR